MVVSSGSSASSTSGPLLIMWSLLSWNVAGRIRRWPEQLAAVSQINADVIALQEVTMRSSHMWRQALTERGWAWFVFSFDLAPAGFVARGPRRFGLVLASRFPIAVNDPNRFAVPWPERVLTAAIQLPHAPVDVSTTHVPPGASNGWIKIEHLEALHHRFASTPACARLLCGDFNTPRRELPDGQVITFGQTEDGRVSRPRGGRWDAAERGIVTGLRDIGMPDVFRELYGYELQPASWILKRHGRTFERRFDHVFADPRLRPQSFIYRHDLRQSGASDHSAAVVRFAGPA